MTSLSEVGKGHLGVATRRKGFNDLLDESGTQKDVVCILKPVREITSDWAVHSGDCYVTPYKWVFDYIRRDVVGIKTEDEILARAESIADCISTGGTFFYDVDEEFPGGVAAWDDSSNYWQIPTHTFDGSTYMIFDNGDLDEVDSKKGTVSFWIYLPETYTSGITRLFNSGNNYFQLYIAAGVPKVFGKNAAGTIILALRGTTDLRDGTWHHCAFSWDLGTTSGQYRLDGVDDLSATKTLTDDIINYDDGDSYCYGARSDGNAPMESGAIVGQFWMSWDAQEDISDFYGAGRPVGLNLDGTTSDGTSITTAPQVFLYDSADDGAPQHNFGSAGENGKPSRLGTVTGTFTQGDHTPNHPDGAILWDQFPKLYAHLTDDSDPSTNTLVAVHYFPFATQGTHHPHIGDTELVTDGDFENWDDVNTLTDWAFLPSQTGKTTITRESSSVKEGTYSLSFVADGSESADWNYVGQLVNLQAGADYRISGWYRWEPDDDNDNATYQMWPYFKIRNSVSTDSIASDGRSNISNTAHRVDNSQPTPNKWFRFFMDFKAFTELVATSARLEIHMGMDLGTKGKLIFDDIRIRRIWSWDFHSPRLSSASIPNIDTGSRDIFFGGKEIGNGSIELINSEGYLERLIGECEWMNSECIVDIGGKWIEGDEVPREDMFRGFTGLIQDLDCDDNMARFEVQDQRAFFHITLPPRYYDDNDFPNMDTKNFQGKPRPIFFGGKENITPARIDYGTSSDYGKYEIADCDRAPNGIKVITKIYAYIDETAAGLKRSDQRIELTSGTDFTEDLANGQFTIISDVGPYVIDDANSYLDFDEGGAELNAVIPAGLYTADDLAAEIETQLESQGAAGYTVTYSDSTHKFTIESDGATLNLLCKTGTNKNISIWKTIGFKKSTDRSTTNETGDNATFDSADTDHVLRVNASGFKDDASGTYTGSSNGLIETGADILRVILLNYMVKPPSIIDSASFALARSRGAESLTLYTNETISTRDLFESLEYSNIANIIINGEGKVFYKIYVGDVPDNITLLEDKDFQEFNSGKSSGEVFTTIRVLFDKDPTTGKHRARERTDNSVRVRLGRPDTKEFPTMLKLSDSAINCAVRYSVLSSAAARKISGTVLGSKLMNLEVGDKVKVVRRRAIAIGGVIVNRIFRILSLSKNPLDGTVDFFATDDQVTVANQQCISTCMALCEGGNCQELCEQSCQEFCKTPGNCQDLCEGTCQGDPCQEVDQECVVDCKDACELGSCQSACELVTQDCPGCQTYCETHGCQGACELNPCQSCQNNCQAGTVCMNDCEEGVTCQDSCETGSSCEEPCEQPGNCKETCELQPCQDSCQTGSCMSYCETTTCQQVDETAPP